MNIRYDTKIKFRYDPDADVLSLENGKTSVIDYAQEMGNVIVHFNKTQKPVLIEVLDASRLFKKEAKVIQKIKGGKKMSAPFKSAGKAIEYLKKL